MAKPYKFIGFSDIHGPKTYKFIGFGDIHSPKVPVSQEYTSQPLEYIDHLLSYDGADSPSKKPRDKKTHGLKTQV